MSVNVVMREEATVGKREFHNEEFDKLNLLIWMYIFLFQSEDLILKMEARL
jgi:hypothetical protein